MTAAADTLALLARAFARRPPPRVRALHLPPAPWRGAKDGEFGAVELDDGSVGLSYVLLDDALAALAEGGAAARVAGADALALAGAWAGGESAQRAVAFAAVNALTRHLFDRAGFVPPPAGDSIGGLDAQPGDHVGMVGLFPPLLGPLAACGVRLTVVELRPGLVGEQPGLRVTLDAAELRACDKVLVTSTVLLNDTLDAVLANCAGARRVVMIGPGAGCLPDALFARGVTAMAGSWIDDAAAVVAALAAGAPWGRHARKFVLARTAYPGLPALLEGEASRHGGGPYN
jgi:uncharacterized protein (DUF4213/DUF364 family)